jgi:Holliday junction resolvase RusA-like endonuclease
VIKKFTVIGEPKGKGRPRFNPYARKSRPRTPEDTLIYENRIGWEYRQQCVEAFPDNTPVKMSIHAYYAIPKSESKKRKLLTESGKMRPTKKPDIDNVVKVFADALNGVAYHDDTQIVSLTCEKYYSYEPRVEVRLESIEGGNADVDPKNGTGPEDQ